METLDTVKAVISSHIVEVAVDGKAVRKLKAAEAVEVI